MSSVPTGKWHQDLETIFRGGSLASLSDGQLLELFLGRRDEAREQAFKTLVDRHGPMVYRVCGQVLGDCHEAQDAFQAVFLVLARKAGAVRDRESLGSWLHGVALRVAARARSGLNRRKAREQQADDGQAEIAAPAGSAARNPDDAEALHQEVARLSDKYRAPIVLCYLEGLTHDQAAARLNWPVGTVRSRLARARDQLRLRLVRRGVTVPATLGPLAGWLGFEAAGIADAATLNATVLSTVPAGLLATTVRTGCQMADGKMAAVALFSSSAFSLTRGVLNTMALEKMATLAWTLLPAGILVITAGLVVGHEPGSRSGQKPQEAAAPKQESRGVAAPTTAEPPDPVDPLVRQLMRAARERLDSQRAFYEEGRITLDRFVLGSVRLMEVERMVARNEAETLSAIKRHLGRLQEIENRRARNSRSAEGPLPMSRRSSRTGWKPR